MMNNLDHILESLLFVAEDPLTVDRLKAIFETVEPKEIRNALHSLAERYETRGGGFGLYEIAGGWQLRSRPEYNEWIKRMLQPPPQRLTKATLETLAIVAYNQPIIRSDIEHIRGVDCGGVLRQLMERKLIRVLGRKEIPGRPLIYATTKYFLELFDLRDLKDLPSPKEIETLTAAREIAADAADGTAEADNMQDGMSSGSVLIDRFKETVKEDGPEEFAAMGNGTGGNDQNRNAGALNRGHVGSIHRPPLCTPPAHIADGLPRISTPPSKLPVDREKL